MAKVNKNNNKKSDQAKRVSEELEKTLAESAPPSEEEDNVPEWVTSPAGKKPTPGVEEEPEGRRGTPGVGFEEKKKTHGVEQEDIEKKIEKEIGAPEILEKAETCQREIDELEKKHAELEKRRKVDRQEAEKVLAHIKDDKTRLSEILKEIKGIKEKDEKVLKLIEELKEIEKRVEDVKKELS